MWIALTVPGMVLGCRITIVPVLYGSIRDCRTEAALRLEDRCSRSSTALRRQQKRSKSCVRRVAPS